MRINRHLTQYENDGHFGIQDTEAKLDNEASTNLLMTRDCWDKLLSLKDNQCGGVIWYVFDN